jgi:phosphate transport system permease protein
VAIGVDPAAPAVRWSSGVAAGTPFGRHGTVVDARPPEGGDRRPRRVMKSATGTGDRVFRTGSLAAGLAVLAIMAAVGLFLSIRALQALKSEGPEKFLTTQAWQPDSHNFGVAAVMSGTILIALVAIIISFPMGVGTALFISEVSPRWAKQTLISLVDLMAAVPSVVYGLWGLFWLQGHVVGVARWISAWFGWIPIFHVPGADPNNPLSTASVYTASAFIAGIVVAMMVVPIQCSVMREVFSQAPPGEREGAYALGSTRWGMIRSVVLPFGKGGIIGATMLGLGRALGETIAVYLIISPVFRINFHILGTGTNSVSSLIALHYGDSSTFGTSALMAAGLSLFILTLIVNFTASTIVARSRSGAQTD